MDIGTAKALGSREPAFRYAAILMETLAPSFGSPWRLAICPRGPSRCKFRIVLEYVKEGDPITKGTAADIFTFDRHVEIPIVSLPEHLYRQGLMISALGKLVETASRDGVVVYVTDLVPRYRSSLMARGAHPAPRRADAVQLHVGMNFLPFTQLA